MTQAYYDHALEPLFNAAVPLLAELKEALPPPLTAVALVAGGALLAAGLCIFSLGLKGVVALTVVAVTRRVYARKVELRARKLA